MTKKQIDNYNSMLRILKNISKSDSAERLKRNSERSYGLDYVEALEMSYENLQGLAGGAVRNVRQIKINHPTVGKDPGQ